MAGSSLFALIDDIATILDDVSVMTKVAAKKTAGVLGDDLALNAEQVTGVASERELPVVWAVAKGSSLNKLILVPAALLISAVAPWAVVPLLMIGGAFLCFEGVEKLVHRYLHREEAEKQKAQLHEAVRNPAIDLVALEKDKIRGAIRTDFVLSAEIITITLGVVAAEPFIKQLSVLTAIAVFMTLGVYGFVALIVKLDDAGLHLSRKEGALRQLGFGILAFAPWLMKALSVAGTAAMFLVGGGILVHGTEALHHLSEKIGQAAAGITFGSTLATSLFDGVVGIIAGALVLAVVLAAKKVFGRKA